MSTGAPDQAQRVDEVDGLNGRYNFVHEYDEFMFVDENTNWLEHFSPGHEYEQELHTTA